MVPSTAFQLWCCRRTAPAPCGIEFVVCHTACASARCARGHLACGQRSLPLGEHRLHRHGFLQRSRNLRRSRLRAPVATQKTCAIGADRRPQVLLSHSPLMWRKAWWRGPFAQTHTQELARDGRFGPASARRWRLCEFVPHPSPGKQQRVRGHQFARVCATLREAVQRFAYLGTRVQLRPPRRSRSSAPSARDSFVRTDFVCRLGSFVRLLRVLSRSWCSARVSIGDRSW